MYYLVTTVKLLGKLCIYESERCKSGSSRGSRMFLKLQPEINRTVFWLKPKGFMEFGYFYWYDIIHANEHTGVCAQHFREHRRFLF